MIGIPMNADERKVYNTAQLKYDQAKALRKQADELRDEANAMRDARLKAERERDDEERKEKLRKDREMKENAERQEFSNRINRICLALGEAVKKESLQIDGGFLAGSPWSVGQAEKKIFTLQNYSFPRMTADVYAVANKGFRWEIKMG